MAFMSLQLEKLGISFRRLTAVTPSTLDDHGCAFNWNSWERPLKDTEKACFLSHFKAWEHAAASSHKTLILEDDALLSHYLPQVLAAIDASEEVEHLSLEVRSRKKIVSKQGREVSAEHNIFRLYQDRSGAAAYVLSPRAARKLLARSKKQVALADAMICQSYELKSFQIEPACAVQLDRAEEYGLVTPFQTTSQIDFGKSNLRKKSGIAFRIRRIGAQFRMAFRLVRSLGYSDRRNIELRGDDFLHAQTTTTTT
jgi:glycosyl transferase family 25